MKLSTVYPFECVFRVEENTLGAVFLLSVKTTGTRWVGTTYFTWVAYLVVVFIYISFSVNTTTDIHGACVYVCMYKVAVLKIRIE